MQKVSSQFCCFLRRNATLLSKNTNNHPKYTCVRPLTSTTHTSTRSSSSSSHDKNENSSPLVRERVKAYPRGPIPFPKPVPTHIRKPPYADSGVLPIVPEEVLYIHKDEFSIERMRKAAQLARQALDFACSLAQQPQITTTDEIDTQVHEFIIQHNAYPSPLNYAGFPKSMCSSVNEVICHGIPDTRPLQYGDIVSFDVSCFLNGVHGDNCATVIVGDTLNNNNNNNNDNANDNLQQARRLVQAAKESLYAGIEACRPGGCLTDIGSAIHQVADDYGYNSVRKYRGHGISHVFHCPPFVKHYRNNDKLKLIPGMIFTIEPMLTEGSQDCHEWPDQWTVVTDDGSMAAQFEHTVLITESGVEILTLPP